jgi:LemA protein
MTLEIILGIIVILSLLSSIFVFFHNKFQFAIIKIDKAEEDITLYLQKKEELLNRAKPIIEKELKITDVMNDLDCIPVDSSNFEAHFLLKKAYNEFFRTLDEHEKLLKSKPLEKIIEELDENEGNIVGSIKFYNDTVLDYNQLVISFPSSIVAFIRRYQKKEFYSNEKKEKFQVLNEK